MKRFFSTFYVWMLFVSMGLLTSCVGNEDNVVVPDIPEPQPQEEVTEFFNETVNKMIDENYELVKANGYAKLVIPKSLYREGLFTFSANATGDMQCMVNAGYKAYVNGGSVRDAVMGKPSHDVDFSTNASIEQIVAIVPNSKSFNAFKNIWVVKAYHEGDIETDIAPIFAIFPEYSGKANVPVAKDLESPYSEDLLEDTYSRDFTFNSLYYDFGTGDVIDYHGGLHDLREGVVNTVITADFKVPMDPRTILRGLRFAAKYQFTISAELDKAYIDHVDALKDLDTYNSIYNMESGFNGGFALRYFKLLEQYKVTDYFMTSLTDRLQTADYKNFTEGMLGEFDKVGKADMALSFAAIFWPRFADDIQAKENPTKEDVAAIWTTIDSENKENFKFDYKDYTYIPQFIQDVWYLQLLMTDPTNQTAEKSVEIRKSERFAEALRFLKARAALDGNLAGSASYWSE